MVATIGQILIIFSCNLGEGIPVHFYTNKKMHLTGQPEQLAMQLSSKPAAHSIFFYLEIFKPIIWQLPMYQKSTAQAVFRE